MNSSLRTLISFALIFSSICQAQTPEAEKERLRLACTGIAEWEAHKVATPAMEATGRVSRPELRNDLLSREARDQKARDALNDQSGKDLSAAAKAAAAVDAGNLKVLRRVFAQYGSPSPEMIGSDGVLAFWLLVQHADRDVELQEKVLQSLMAARKGIPLDEIAVLTDRVRVNKGQSQLYGTQFHEVDGRLVPIPIENEAALAQRRQAMNLMPLSDYECALKATYNISDK
jgi:hypothetical protein